MDTEQFKKFIENNLEHLFREGYLNYHTHRDTSWVEEYINYYKHEERSKYLEI